MKRLRLVLALSACALAAIAAMSAHAAPRMLIGFQDDPSLRWRDDRQGENGETSVERGHAAGDHLT